MLLLCVGFSVVDASGGYSLVAVHGLLIAVVQLHAEHRLWSMQASVFAAQRLSGARRL